MGNPIGPAIATKQGVVTTADGRSAVIDWLAIGGFANRWSRLTAAARIFPQGIVDDQQTSSHYRSEHH